MVIARVKMWGHNVGAVAWDEDRKIGFFEYEKSFLNLGLEISPLVMPIDKANNSPIFSFPLLPSDTFKGLPGLLADSLPDKHGTTLVNEWLIAQGRDINSFSPVERLCYIGKRGMGALEFEPAINDTNHKLSRLELSSMVQLTNDILQKRLSLNVKLNDVDEEAILRIVQIGASAGGARPKAIVAYNHKTKEILSGQFDIPEGFVNCVLKLDGVTNDHLDSPREYGRIEYAYHIMAIDSGIIMSNCDLIEDNGRAHFITQRFDRLPNNEKLHMQSLCGLAHFDFNNPNIHSYEQAFHVMRVLALPYPDAEQMYTRMVFNDIAKNYDDHAKNFSFLMDKTGTWQLSPAYDITYAYNPTNMWIQRHQLSINGKREKINENDFLDVAKQMSIKKPKEIIEKIRDVVRNWKDYGKECGVSNDRINAIDKTINLNNDAQNKIFISENKN